MTWRETVGRIETPLLVAAVLLAVVGVLAVGSATYAGSGIPSQTWRQLGWVGLGVLALCAAAVVDYRFLAKWSPVIYFLSVLLLAVTLFSGEGARRWLAVGPFSFQPSEFAKVALIITLARVLSLKGFVESLGGLTVPAALGALPAVLTLIEPDLTTAAVFIPITFGMMFAAGASYLRLLILASPFITFGLSFNLWFVLAFLAVLTGALIIKRWSLLEKTLGFSAVVLNAVVGISTPFFWGMLRDYQKERLLAFVNPGTDPRGAGYSMVQSKIAIGSGQLFGKGYLEGPQTHLRFLPESHTDFIFPVISEEFGFVGSAFVLALFFVILYRAVAVARDANSGSGELAAAGIFIYFLTHVSVNLSMALGLLPVAGLPLPFLSYGGSITVAAFVCVGLLTGIAYRSRAARRW